MSAGMPTTLAMTCWKSRSLHVPGNRRIATLTATACHRAGALCMPGERKRLPVAGAVRWQRDAGGTEHVHDAAGRGEPVLLERGAVVHVAHGRVARRRRIVRDDVAARGEADDRQQVTVGALIEEEAGELIRIERQRRHERDAG